MISSQHDLKNVKVSRIIALRYQILVIHSSNFFIRTPELQRESMYFKYQTYLHYRINNSATTIIKTTNVINVPPTTTGIKMESIYMISAFISKKKRNYFSCLEQLIQCKTNRQCANTH